MALCLDGVALGWFLLLFTTLSLPFCFPFAALCSTCVRVLFLIPASGEALLVVLWRLFTPPHLCAGTKNNTRIGIGMLVVLWRSAWWFLLLSLLFCYSFSTLALLFCLNCIAPSRGIAPLPREQPAFQAPAARHKSPRSFLYIPHFYQSFLPKVWFIRKKMLPLRPKFSFNTLIFL